MQVDLFDDPKPIPEEEKPVRKLWRVEVKVPDTLLVYAQSEREIRTCLNDGCVFVSANPAEEDDLDEVNPNPYLGEEELWITAPNPAIYRYKDAPATATAYEVAGKVFNNEALRDYLVLFQIAEDVYAERPFMLLVFIDKLEEMITSAHLSGVYLEMAQELLGVLNDCVDQISLLENDG